MFVWRNIRHKIYHGAAVSFVASSPLRIDFHDLEAGGAELYHKSAGRTSSAATQRHLTNAVVATRFGMIFDQIKCCVGIVSRVTFAKTKCKPFPERQGIITFWAALQDIDLSMGPTAKLVTFTAV